MEGVGYTIGTLSIPLEESTEYRAKVVMYCELKKLSDKWWCRSRGIMQALRMIKGGNKFELEEKIRSRQLSREAE